MSPPALAKALLTRADAYERGDLTDTSPKLLRESSAAISSLLLRLAESRAQRDALADALRAWMPPERGIHGGPLVCGVWRYEDGTDENSARHKGQIAPHTVAKARAALALLERDFAA